MQILRLKAGELEVELAPQIGGSILAFRRRGAAVMRETPAEAIRQGDVRRAACFPLLPYSNRIGHGRFAFAGRLHALERAYTDHLHPIHGFGLRRAWSVAAADARCAELRMDHRPAEDGVGDWPFACALGQRFELEPSGLSVELELANMGAEAMPGGLGLHPYFPRSETTRLGFQASGVWLAGPDQLPREKVAVPDPWDFSTGRDLGAGPIDNDFTGWAPPAIVEQPDLGYRLRIEADAVFSHLIVYAPPGRTFFAAEPVSHMIDALNRPPGEGGGMAVLAPGERLAGRVRFAVEAL